MLLIESNESVKTWVYELVQLFQPGKLTVMSMRCCSNQVNKRVNSKLVHEMPHTYLLQAN